MQSPSGFAAGSVPAAIAAIHARYVDLARRYSRARARVSGGELCAEFAEELAGILALLARNEGDTGAAPVASGGEACTAGSPSTSASGEACSAVAATRSTGRPTTAAQRIAYRNRRAGSNGATADGPLDGVGTRAVATPVAGAYDPLADARAVAASLRAHGGKQ